jgi:isopenicillin N synthase-like dioxygenase
MKATTVSLQALTAGSVPFTTLEDAFGESSLGILVVNDLPARYAVLREKLLSYSSYLAHLPEKELDALTDAASHYEIGWSHGKEALSDGRYDTMKGSYYVDCQSFFLDDHPIVPGKTGTPATTTTTTTTTRGAGTNLWPSETAMPGFRATFEELCTLLLDIGVLVARAVDRYASTHIPQYRSGYLEHVVRTSHTPKARLLHYFPPPVEATADGSHHADADASVSWCATHLDDGCLTALTSALYIDESNPLPPLLTGGWGPQSVPFPPPDLPILPTSPDPNAGLYIRSRGDEVVKVDIPADCIAFQTGEALQMITDGMFKAVPHFVRGPRSSGTAGAGASRKIARNTLALFMQPDVDEVIDKDKGMTYGQFVDMIVERHS